MATHFIADLHLDPARPELAAILHRYLAGAARDAEALYILGDLFEVWVGDDGSLEPHRETATALRALVDSGVPAWFQRGNRDFAVGPTFCAATGLQLLDDPAVIDLHGRRTVLTHGDALCTDDHAQLRFRERYTDPRWLARMLALPLWLRRGIARYGRARSRLSHRRKPRAIMDATDDAVSQSMATHHANLLIHGHTHRPADHVVRWRDGDGHRLVLADWRANCGEVLVVDEHGWQRQPLH
ncbi:MAG: UDP-2,3-diacylglucosamine diphosphatase [Salinisphaera sp.]|nr:UDP-2,3-diacylglucosamine diphosphatase [Salinisphaera sp.]